MKTEEVTSHVAGNLHRVNLKGDRRFEGGRRRRRFCVSACKEGEERQHKCRVLKFSLIHSKNNNSTTSLRASRTALSNSDTWSLALSVRWQMEFRAIGRKEYFSLGPAEMGARA